MARCCCMLVMASLSASTVHGGGGGVGCTDSGADNFVPAAEVDSGGCLYSCAGLRARLHAPSEASCLIYDSAAKSWPRGQGPVIIPAGDAWIIQGRPPAGWRPGQPEREAQPSSLPLLDVGLDVRGSSPQAWVSLRYVNSSCPPSNSNGGAITARNSIVAAEHSIFEANAANADGGAIYVVSSSLSISHSWLEGNTALFDNGGAVWAESSSVSVSRSVLSRNRAPDGGGGAIWSNNGNLSVESCWFEGNEVAHDGGAIAQHSGGALTLQSSLFYRNVAGGFGGAVDLWTASADLSGVLSACHGVGNLPASAVVVIEGNGVTAVSYTQADLLLRAAPPAAMARVGTGDHEGAGQLESEDDEWAYLSYVYPESRPCKLEPMPALAVLPAAGPCSKAAGGGVAEGQSCSLSCASSSSSSSSKPVLEGDRVAKCSSGSLLWKARCLAAATPPNDSPEQGPHHGKAYLMTVLSLVCTAMLAFLCIVGGGAAWQRRQQRQQQHEHIGAPLLIGGGSGKLKV